MNHPSKSILSAGIITLSLSLSLSTGAAAQSSDFEGLRQNNNLSVNAGVHFTMPLGAKRKHRVEDEARFGLKMTYNRDYQTRSTIGFNTSKMDVLDFGFRLDGSPSLLMNGQDMYAPLFDRSYADGEEDGEQSKAGGGNAALIVVGVVVAAGAAFVVADAAEDLAQCVFSAGFSDECDAN